MNELYIIYWDTLSKACAVQSVLIIAVVGARPHKGLHGRGIPPASGLPPPNEEPNIVVLVAALFVPVPAAPLDRA